MYRQLLAAVLMLAFTVQTFNQGLIVLGFYANQDAIANKLCVNKAKPKMLCHGKCQLMKKLQEEEKNDKENSERKIDNKSEISSARCQIVISLLWIQSASKIEAYYSTVDSLLE